MMMKLKMVAAVRRKPGMTHSEFLHYIEQVHGAISRAKPLGVRRYVQNHVFDGAFGAEGAAGYQQPFHRDSVTELFFDDFIGIKETFSDPYTQQKIGPDAINFADFTEQLAQLMVEEPMAVPNPGGGQIKVLYFIKKAANISLEEFFMRWAEAHAAEHAANAEFAACVRKHVQARYLPDGDRVTAHFGANIRVCEGVASLWFDDEADLQAFRRYQRGIEARSDAGAEPFLDASHSFFVYAHEVAIF